MKIVFIVSQMWLCVAPSKGGHASLAAPGTAGGE
ncbi:protein of unknown function [Cupriavidus taiwanensis]|nr:protein of unknown function [Cupriavidus taiwanensis]SOZ42822.1 protein of unknown function [Cupriavidus taiwanensis]